MSAAYICTRHTQLVASQHSVLPCGGEDFVDKQEHGFLAGQVDPPSDNVHELGHCEQTTRETSF